MAMLDAAGLPNQVFSPAGVQSPKAFGRGAWEAVSPQRTPQQIQISHSCVIRSFLFFSSFQIRADLL
jgi:hypothetical protein